MTSGLPQVCKLGLWVSKGTLSEKHLAPKILMTFNQCGHQLTQRLGWAVPAYHKREGATPHPEAYKHSLQYVGRPDGCLGVRVGMWNLGSLSGKGGQVCEKLIKRMNDARCLQEVRWRGHGARLIRTKGRTYKLWWHGKGDGVGGEGAMVKEELK